ncbi:MAG: FAD-binding oxidoreductase [Deltaproteobacteria bacterium]|nr:FAD-binding oxidoreductase [Deltaproteobacteria bacterium]
MEITKEIYSVLASIVKPEYISDDPVICEGYRSGPGGYESGLGYERVMTKVPGCVIMPRTTEEVQKIVKVCYRHNIPYVPYSTGFYGPRSHPHVKGALLIDLKRMNDFVLDEKHFYVEVGPGMVYSPIQEECMKHGAYVVIGGGGAQASAIANLIGDGWSPLSHRIGLPHRRILGTEVVMPDGELLKLGSLAEGCDDPFWGECPGPDLRGLLRGYTGLRGCMGIVTRMAIKTLPFQPERLLPSGISPNTALILPEKRVKWINFVVPSKEAQVKAMKEIGHAEIAGAVTKVPLFWRAIAKAECKEDFWDIWGKENEETVANFHIVRVLLIGFTSEEQMAYDERVLMDIMSEVGGIARPTKPSDESWIKNADSAGMWLMCGGYVSVDYVIETMSQAPEHGPAYAELKKKYTPPLMPDYGDPGWFQSFEMGHQGYSEFLVYWDQDDNTDPVDQFYVDTSKMNIKNRFYTSLLGPHQPLYLTGPQYGPNYHEFLLKVKNEFDPKWMSHPPVPLAHDVFVDRAPWMQNMKDWESPKDLKIPGA